MIDTNGGGIGALLAGFFLQQGRFFTFLISFSPAKHSFDRRLDKIINNK